MTRSPLLALALALLAAPAALAGVDPVDAALDATDFPGSPQPHPAPIDPRSAELFDVQGIELVPATDLPFQDTPAVTTPDVQPTPAQPVADLDYAGTVHVLDRNGEFCVQLSAGELDHQTVFCLNEDVPALVARGDYPLGVDQSLATPPLPGAPVPNVASVPEGYLVSTASYELGVTGTLHWDCGRMETFLDALGVQTYRPFPVGPEGAVWLAEGGGETVGLTVTATIRQDGEVVRTYEVTVPLVGQVLAAAGRPGDPLSEVSNAGAWCR